MRSAALFVAVLFLAALPWIRVADHAAPCSATAVPADQWLVVWALGWVGHALVTDPAHVVDANINHPAPAQLSGMEHFGSTQLVFGPVFWTTGNAVLAANVAALVSYPLAALAMERLLLALGCGGLVAWAAGLLFALGPVRVPGDLLVLKYPNVYLPLVALALTRLRERPALGRAALLALALGLGLFSSFYMALMILVAGGLWGLFELGRPGPGRARFTALALAATLAAVGVLVVASQPWYARPELDTMQPFPQVLNIWAGGVHTRTSGQLPLALAAAGCLALATGIASARRAGFRGLLLALTGQILMLGPTLPVTDERSVTLPFALFAATPAAFFRYPFRFVVVLGFGTALLAAAALEAAGRGLGRRAGLALVAAVGAVVLATRAPALTTSCWEDFSAAQHPIYPAVAEAARTWGPGPLLELPLLRPAGDPKHRGTEVESMVASTRHWLPLVAGYLDYPPPHRPLLDATLATLPSSEALADLIDMTGLRWLLLHPAAEWQAPHRPAQTALLKEPEVRGVIERDGWQLLRVERRPRHPEWAAAIAAGLRSGHTVLGTPLVPLPADTSLSLVHATGPVPDPLPVNRFLVLDVRVVNLGRTAWPVAVPRDAPPTHTVHLLARWWPSGSRTVAAQQELPLRRDVPAGESISQHVLLAAPETPGTYDFELAVEQVDAPRLDGGANQPLRIRVRRIPPVA